MNGKESERFKKKWLEWVLNFVDIKPKKLPPGKKYHLKLEAFYFTCPEFRFQDEDRFFEWLTVKRHARMEKEINMGMLQQKLKPIVNFLRSYSLRPADDGKIRPIFSLAHTLPDVTLSLEVDPESRDLQIVYRPVQYGYLSYAVLNLVSLLDPHSLDSIVQCKGCGKYFIDLTKRKKNYCSSSCAARYNARIKREDLKEHHPKEYKAYLRKQKERMRSLRKKPIIKQEE